jgi:hypothetical protein
MANGYTVLAGVGYAVVRTIIDGSFERVASARNYPCRGVLLSMGRICQPKYIEGYTEYNRLFNFQTCDSLKEGEEVLYDWNASFNPPWKDGNKMLISQEALIGVHRGVWRGINGWTLFEKLEEPYGMTPSGKKLIYQKALRLELDVFNTLTNSEHSLFKSKDVIFI